MPQHKIRRKQNSFEDAEGMYEDFHGHPSSGFSKVTTMVHEHENLAELGELKKLTVMTLDGAVVDLTGFDGAILSTNEDGTQLYVEGGDQELDLEEFEFDSIHESEVLGEALKVEYHTIKDHLGNEGGEAIYDHEFGEEGGTGPMVIYDTRNHLIGFSGGSYEILPEGIAN